MKELKKQQGSYRIKISNRPLSQCMAHPFCLGDPMYGFAILESCRPSQADIIVYDGGMFPGTMHEWNLAIKIEAEEFLATKRELNFGRES